MHHLQPRLREIHHRFLTAYDDFVRECYLNQVNVKSADYATWFIRSGEVEITSSGKDYHVEKDHWVFFDPFDTRSLHFAKGTRIMSIRFQLEWKQSFTIVPTQNLRVFGPSGFEDLHEAGMRLCEANTGTESQPFQLARECARHAAFYNWLSCWYAHRMAQVPDVNEAAHGISDERIHLILTLLGERTGLGVIDYPQLEKRVNLSRSQIDRLFKSQTGMTPRQWCERRALAQAQELLYTTNLSIKQISHSLGFVDSSHFAKWFQKQSKQSPKHARERH